MGTIARAMNLSLQIWGSAITVIFILCMFGTRHVKRKLDHYYLMMLVFNMGSLLFDAAALYFRGRMGTFSSIMVRATNFSSFACGGFLSLAFILYMREYIQRKLGRQISRLAVYISAVGLAFHMLTLVVNLFLAFAYRIGADNLYVRADGYVVLYINGFLNLLVGLILLMRHRKSLDRIEFVTFLVYVLLPLVTGIIATTFYGVAIGQFGVTMTLIIMYVYLQAEYGRKMAEQENELIQSQMTMMMSQIRPHFLYNVLNSIRYLCEEDAEAAAAAIDHFSLYLRTNMENMSRKEPVPVLDEIEHVKNYLYIEHLRFPEIRVEYDLQCTDFKVPALTIQPTVENAVKHGYSMKHKEGTIRIRTWEDEENACLSVEDDGMGFEVDREQMPDGRTHLGVENTRRRVEMICHGSYEIESEVGKGTKVTMRFPR